MKVCVLGEYGYSKALFGIGLSYGLTSGKQGFPDLFDKLDEWDNEEIPKEYQEEYVLFQRLKKIARKLAFNGNAKEITRELALKGNAENKFLRQISVVLDVVAPLYWWKEADTYKVGTTAQSESTMHTLMKNSITQDNFEKPIYEPTLKYLEGLRLAGEFEQLVNELPCGWLQRRILTCNYAVLQNIYAQRNDHKLKEWHVFCYGVTALVEHPYFITRI